MTDPIGTALIGLLAGGVFWLYFGLVPRISDWLLRKLFREGDS